MTQNNFLVLNHSFMVGYAYSVTPYRSSSKRIYPDIGHERFNSWKNF